MAASGVCGSKSRELRAHISTCKEDQENELGVGRDLNLEGFESLPPMTYFLQEDQPS